MTKEQFERINGYSNEYWVSTSFKISVSFADLMANTIVYSTFFDVLKVPTVFFVQGWGCEDDMFIRVVHSCVGLEHVQHEYARYKMIYRKRDSRMPQTSEFRRYSRTS